MKLSRRYQVLPDQAACHQPGCSWHCHGELAAMLAEAHTCVTGHEARVDVRARLIFSDQRAAAANPAIRHPPPRRWL